jgi:hypothetical protein
MNPILEALNSGFSAKKVLDFIKNMNPDLANKINLAINSGHSIEKILQFITRSGKNLDKMLPKSAPSANVYQQAQSGIHEEIPRIAKGAAAIGGTALGAYALSRAIPQAIIPEILPAQAQIPFSPRSLAGQLPKQIGQVAPAQAQVPPDPMQQAAQQVQPAKPIVPQVSPDIIIEQMGVKDRVDTMLQAGNSPDAIAATLTSLGRNRGKTDADLVKVINDYAASRPVVPTVQPEQKMPSPKVESIQFEKPTDMRVYEVGNLALLPKGDIGEIEAIKNGIAKVNVDGRITHRKLDDLEEMPISQPDLATLYENLIQAIPNELKSKVINFAGYDPNANELIFRPHNGPAYVYKNIPPEFAEKLKNAMFQAKTSGENFYGSWSEGGPSRFAGLSQLIKELQKEYGGKGKEYVRKYETLVDILAEPEKAKKEKHQALMAEKKKLREEAKKKKEDEKKSKKRKKPIS